MWVSKSVRKSVGNSVGNSASKSVGKIASVVASVFVRMDGYARIGVEGMRRILQFLNKCHN